jgi:hypothetical protein
MSEKISISAAIRRASRIRGQIKEHSERAKAAACYLETKEPAFPFNASVEERRRLVGDLLRIETAVAKSNASAADLDVSPKVSVLYAIRKLAELKSEISFYRELPVRAKEKDAEVEEVTEYDYSVKEHVRREKKTTYVSAMTQARRAAIVDGLQADFDRLNQVLESHNHSTFVEV